jgi:hypothetical protein
MGWNRAKQQWLDMKFTISVIQPWEVRASPGILRDLSKGKSWETRGIPELAS